MWSKFFKKNKENKTEEISAEEAISTIIKDIAMAIQKCEISLADAQKDKNEITNTYFFHQEKSKELYQKAMQAMKNGDEKKAKTFLNDKNIADIATKNYENIYENANQNVKKLELQLLKMNTQLVEVKTKKSILIAQLSQAQTQKEITQKLQSLQISTDDFENQIIYAQAENFIEQDEFNAKNNELDLFQEINQEKIDLKALEKDIEKENQQKKQQQIINQTKKIEGFFDNKNKPIPNPKKEITEDKMKEFFDTKNSSKEENKEEIKNEKKDIVEDFFNSKNNDKDKKINDFFNNNS